MASAERVEIIAHRGTREGAYEHTFAAYRKAIADGADALECDVRLTADGHLVCLHDRRVDFVSDGRGVVSTLDLADFDRVRFGPRRSWRPLDRYRDRPAAVDAGDVDAGDVALVEEPDVDGTGVLTLRRLLELVAAAPRPVGLAIETKHPTRYAGLVERRLVELLAEFGLAGAGGAATGREAAGPAAAAGRPAGGVRVMSFSATSLRRMSALAPELERVLLMGRIPPRRRDGSLPPGVRIAGVDVRVIRRDPGYVARAHGRGNQVHVWTVNAPADVDACLAAGVDALITDRPLAVRGLLGAARATGAP